MEMQPHILWSLSTQQDRDVSLKISAPKEGYGRTEPKEKFNPLLPLTPFSTLSSEAYLAEHRAGPQLVRLEAVTG